MSNYNGWKPMSSRIIVQRVSKEESKGGIILIEDTKKASHEGEVLAVGDETSVLNVGDRIIFARYSPYSFPSNDGAISDDILLMNEEDVICVKEKT